jgi:hypothetical protein
LSHAVACHQVLALLVAGEPQFLYFFIFIEPRSLLVCFGHHLRVIVHV